MQLEYELEEMKKRYIMVMFRDSNGDYSSNSKKFQSHKHLSDYIDDELINYGRKEVGMYQFETWDELMEFRFNNRR